MKCNPDIQLKIINKTTFDTLQQIDQGIIDFGIVSCPSNLNTYTFLKLADIQDIFVAEKEYLEQLQIAQPNDIFTKGGFMLLEGDNLTRHYIDQFLRENNILIKPEVEINTMDFLIEFAKIGLGISLVIKSFVEEELLEGSLLEIPISPSIPPRAVGIVHSKNKPLSIAADAFIASILPHTL